MLTSTGASGQQQPIAQRQWHSGFLPSQFQGVHFRSKGDPVLYVGNPNGVSPGRQRDVIDTVKELNKISYQTVDDPEIATRISQYEMAFKMQSSVPSLMNLLPLRKLTTCEAKGAESGSIVVLAGVDHFG